MYHGLAGYQPELLDTLYTYGHFISPFAFTDMTYL
jgi:hypothetical protein